MPDENRFAGLTDAMEEETNEDADEDAEEDVDAAADSAAEIDDENATVEPDNDGRSSDDGVSPSEDAEPATQPETTADADASTGETDEDRDASGDGDAGGDDEASDPVETPAFAFEESSPKSIYVRDETLALLEDAEFEVEAALRRDHEIRNVTGREFHDAAVRVLAEHAEEVAEEIVRLRKDE